jgi:hypothetical protein
VEIWLTKSPPILFFSFKVLKIIKGSEREKFPRAFLIVLFKQNNGRRTENAERRKNHEKSETSKNERFGKGV